MSAHAEETARRWRAIRRDLTPAVAYVAGLGGDQNMVRRLSVNWQLLHAHDPALATRLYDAIWQICQSMRSDGTMRVDDDRTA